MHCSAGCGLICNHQRLKLFGMIELEKRHIEIANNFYNLIVYCLMEISLILKNPYIVFRDQIKVIF